MAQSNRKSSRTRNTLKPGVGREKSMPLLSDIRYLEETKLPPPDGRRINRELALVINGEMRQTLLTREVSGFFGTRLSTHKIARLSTEAAESEAVRSRMEHGVEIAAQISAPRLADLYQEVAALMRDWELLSEQLPQAADRLKPLAEWWAGIHPGSSGRPARNDQPTPAPLPKPA